MNTIEKYIKVYKLTKQFLNDILPEQITDVELNKYLKNTKWFESINDIYERMALSLQNYQAMPNIIKFEKNIDLFRRILLNFNPHEVKARYTYETLYEEFKNNFSIANPENKQNSWIKFTKGLITGADFLSQFNNHLEFDEFVGKFTKNDDLLLELPNMIKDKVHGFGFALSCDFLKELGYTHYPKPDVHLKDIFFELNLSKYDNVDNYKKIVEMSKAVGETPYEIDKVFWLICSGKYYLHGINTRPRKADLINYIKENLGIK